MEVEEVGEAYAWWRADVGRREELDQFFDHVITPRRFTYLYIQAYEMQNRAVWVSILSDDLRKKNQRAQTYPS